MTQEIKWGMIYERSYADHDLVSDRYKYVIPLKRIDKIGIGIVAYSVLVDKEFDIHKKTLLEHYVLVE